VELSARRANSIRHCARNASCRIAYNSGQGGDYGGIERQKMKYRKYVIGGATVLIMFSIASRIFEGIQQKKGFYGIFESLILPVGILAVLWASVSKPNNSN
jgi:hypothetical protein